MTTNEATGFFGVVYFTFLFAVGVVQDFYIYPCNK